MKPILLTSLLLTVALAVGLAARPRSQSISYGGGDPLSDDCSEHMRVSGHHYDSVVRGEESRSLPNQPLSFSADHNGGIHISSWDKADFSVKLCKEVASDSDEQGRKLLADIKLVVNGSSVSVNSPERHGDYTIGTLLLIKAPRDAQVSMSVLNGGISVRHFDGTVEAKAVNGGISLKESRGKLTVRADNGGISIQDCGGDVTAHVQNGGLSINLPERWDGKGLDAHTQNGGLVIGIPRNFSSGLEITTSNHTPIVCKGDACENGQRTWDDEHRIFRVGSGDPQIRASTVNGGVVIKNSERSREMM